MPLASPALAYSASASKLPACCRRNGAHHCMLKMQDLSPNAGPRLEAQHEKCPAFPATVTPVQQGDLSLHTASLLYAEILSHPSVKPQTLAFARLALVRSRQKRGPPTFSL